MRIALILSALGLIACYDLQFVGPDAVPPTLFINVVVRDDSLSTVTVSVTMRSGREADGQSTQLSDSAIYINGARVTPEVHNSNGDGILLVYAWKADRQSIAADSLLVTGPKLAPSAEAAVTRIGLPTRLDPFAMVLPDSTDLRLHVMTAAAVGIPASSTQPWDLMLAASCTLVGPTYLHISSQYPYPAELRVPFDQLPGTRPSTVAACFHGSAFYPAALTPYRSGVSISTYAEWTIQLQP